MPVYRRIVRAKVRSLVGDSVHAQTNIQFIQFSFPARDITRMPVKLFVGGIPYRATDEELKQHYTSPRPVKFSPSMFPWTVRPVAREASHSSK